MEAHSHILTPPLSLRVSLGLPQFSLEKIAEMGLSLLEKWSGDIWSENSSSGYSSCNGSWGREDGGSSWSPVFGSKIGTRESSEESEHEITGPKW